MTIFVQRAGQAQNSRRAGGDQAFHLCILGADRFCLQAQMTGGAVHPGADRCLTSGEQASGRLGQFHRARRQASLAGQVFDQFS
jgi:hypothetical protein